MTWLIRKVASPTPWLKVGESDADVILQDPPVWAVRDFTPSVKDKGCLSLYRVENDADIDAVAAAFVVHQSISKGIDTVAFAAADLEEVSSAGFRIVSSKGDLNNTLSDPWHVTIELNSLSQIVKLAELFVRGDYFERAGALSKRLVTSAASNGQFDFPVIAGNPDAQASKNLLKFVREGTVKVIGAGLSSQLAL